MCTCLEDCYFCLAPLAQSVKLLASIANVLLLQWTCELAMVPMTMTLRQLFDWHWSWASYIFSGNAFFLHGIRLKLSLVLQSCTSLGTIIAAYQNVLNFVCRSWFTWRDIFHVVDIICCCAIIFPIVWSINNLRKASHVSQLPDHFCQSYHYAMTNAQAHRAKHVSSEEFKIEAF